MVFESDFAWVILFVIAISAAIVLGTSNDETYPYLEPLATLVAIIMGIGIIWAGRFTHSPGGREWAGITAILAIGLVSAHHYFVKETTNSLPIAFGASCAMLLAWILSRFYNERAYMREHESGILAPTRKYIDEIHEIQNKTSKDIEVSLGPAETAQIVKDSISEMKAVVKEAKHGIPDEMQRVGGVIGGDPKLTQTKILAASRDLEKDKVRLKHLYTDLSVVSIPVAVEHHLIPSGQVVQSIVDVKDFTRQLGKKRKAKAIKDIKKAPNTLKSKTKAEASLDELGDAAAKDIVRTGIKAINALQVDLGHVKPINKEGNYTGKVEGTGAKITPGEYQWISETIRQSREAPDREAWIQATFKTADRFQVDQLLGQVEERGFDPRESGQVKKWRQLKQKTNNI